MNVDGKRVLHIDLETYCEANLTEVGIHRYVNDPSFEILLFAYAYDTDFEIEEDPIRQIQEVNRSTDWYKLMDDLVNPDVVKVAHNAAFEMACLENYLHNEKLIGCASLKYKNKHINPKDWICTANLASIYGYPRSLDKLGEAIGLPQDAKKLKTGKELIKYFCCPCKATIANGGRTRNKSYHAPEKWQMFKEYSKQDVVAEHECYIRLLNNYPVDSREHMIWEFDIASNSRGVLIERKMASNIVAYNERYTNYVKQRLLELTGLDNPNSNSQLLTWLKNQGIQSDTIDKETRDSIISQTTNNVVKEVLTLKNELSKSSLAKYEAMLDSMCPDGSVKGMLQYYGAAHTGRWAGRIVQLHNLPKNHMDPKHLDLARRLVIANDFDTLEDCFSNVPDTLSQLIRTAFIAHAGKTFIVCDYSAIEARVISWLADEKWRINTFAKGGDIYCASASQMYGVPVEKHGVNGHLRAKGKVAELALGYQGGANALTLMDFKNELSESEKEVILSKWRAANPNIVDMWSDVEACAVNAIKNPGIEYSTNRCRFKVYGEDLYIFLPSGRWIIYRKARAKSGKMEFIDISDRGVEVWSKTYGGKLVENIVQATARDCLAYAMLRLSKAGYDIRFHVHDEVIVEVPDDDNTEKNMNKIKELMAVNEDWMNGLLLTAEGYSTKYYMKD